VLLLQVLYDMRVNLVLQGFDVLVQAGHLILRTPQLLLYAHQLCTCTLLLLLQLLSQRFCICAGRDKQLLQQPLLVAEPLVHSGHLCVKVLGEGRDVCGQCLLRSCTWTALQVLALHPVLHMLSTSL